MEEAVSSSELLESQELRSLLGEFEQIRNENHAIDNFTFDRIRFFSALINAFGRLHPEQLEGTELLKTLTSCLNLESIARDCKSLLGHK